MRLFAPLSLAQIILLPAIGEVDDRAGHLLLLRMHQAVAQDVAVGRRIAHIAEGQPKGVLDIKGSGRFDEPSHLLDQRQRNRGDTVLVENSLDQSHGLAAHRS